MRAADPLRNSAYIEIDGMDHSKTNLPNPAQMDKKLDQLLQVS